MITFRCPNGHKINSREELVGKSGKCPKCQAAFTVPPVSLAIDPVLGAGTAAAVGQGDPFEFALQEKREFEVASPHPGATPARSATPASSAANPSPAIPSEAHRDGDSPVVFLCPNGHKLNSPARMIGKAGQCPHCQAKFLVPDPDDLPDDDSRNDSTAAQPATSIDVRGAGPIGRPTAELVELLWSLKTREGARIELQLRGEKVLVPAYFSARFSSATHGLFGELEAHGAYRLSAISWDAIERISVIGLKNLPAGVFEAGAAAD